jgi:porin
MQTKRKPFFLTALLLVCALLFTTVTWAEDSKTSGKDIWSRDKLTGDWWGGRTWLTDHGIDIGLRLTQYGQWVSSGGRNTSGQYGGTMDYRVNVDTNKLFGSWKGFSVNMHARTRFGEDVNADAGNLVIQNTGMMMPSPGDYHNTDVTGLIASQYLPFFGGRLANVTAGVLDVVDTVNGFFPNLGYGQEGFWNINSTVTALPWFGAVRGLSLYGAVAVTVNKEFKAPESGVLVTGTTNVSTRWTSLSDSLDDVWMAAFHRFYWKMDDKMGYFMVFGGYSTKEQASNDPHDIIAIPGTGIVNTEEKNPWDIALYLYQDFWQAEGNPDRKATFMMGGTMGPDDPQFAQYHIFAHVETYGLMASRPHDRMGVSGWYNWLSDNFVELVSPVADLRDLYGFELYYNFEVTPWAHLTADLQLVENEWEDDDFAVIPGVRLVMDF